MGITLDLANAANWNLLYSSNRTVTRPQSSGAYYPLPPEDATGGILLDAPFVVVYATSSTAKPSWRSAGFINQKVRVGLLVGGQADAQAFNNQRVLLNKLKLIRWPEYVRQYQLEFYPHYWLEQLSFSVWNYTGTIEDEAISAIDLTRIDLLRVEAKVEAIFNAL